MYEEGKIPFAYRRGRLVMFFNPLGVEAEIKTTYNGETIYEIGTSELADGKIKMSPQSFLIISFVIFGSFLCGGFRPQHKKKYI